MRVAAISISAPWPALGLCLIIPLAGAGCFRDEATAVCADVAPGELVISEIHGDRGTAWVELYNASGAAIDLAGTRVLFRKTDGSGDIITMVRRPLTVEASAYTVLGYAGDDQRPDFIDYGFLADWRGARWLANAAIDVEVCGTRIDRVLYSALPVMGSYSLGTMPPSAEANDLATSWCNDTSETGTPRQANQPCP